MGIGTWTLLIVGALIGQGVTVLNLLAFGVINYLRGDNWEVALESAIHRALKECLDHDNPGIGDPAIDPSPAPGFDPWILKLDFRLVIGICVVVVIIFAGVASLRWCWLVPSIGRPRGDRPSETASSPGDSPLAIRDLAQNQLAEIRLRHAHQPLRLA